MRAHGWTGSVRAHAVGTMTTSCARTGGVGESAVDRLLAASRAVLGHRPGPEELTAIVAAGGWVVDIRPVGLREQDGELPGAIVIDRNQLEWRLDPTSSHRQAGFDDPDRVVVLVCDEGYASSIAAADLRRLGLTGTTDLDGGYQAWRRWSATRSRSS